MAEDNDLRIFNRPKPRRYSERRNGSSEQGQFQRKSNFNRRTDHISSECWFVWRLGDSTSLEMSQDLLIYIHLTYFQCVISVILLNNDIKVIHFDDNSSHTMNEIQLSCN